MEIYQLVLIFCLTSGDTTGTYTKSCQIERGSLFLKEDTCKKEGNYRVTNPTHSFNGPKYAESFKCNLVNVEN